MDGWMDGWMDVEGENYNVLWYTHSNIYLINT